MISPRHLAPFVLLSLAIHAGALFTMRGSALRNFTAGTSQAEAGGVLRARLAPADPPRPIASANTSEPPIRKAEPNPPASILAAEESPVEASPVATTKPVLIQGPSLRALERLASWSTTKVELTISVAESGQVENIETQSDLPLPAETIAGIKKVFAQTRFIPAKQNSVPVKSIVSLTVTIEPSELYPGD